MRESHGCERDLHVLRKLTSSPGCGCARERHRFPRSLHLCTGDEVRAWIREVVLLGCEVWVADDDGVVALLVLKDDWIDQLYVDARSACATRQ